MQINKIAPPDQQNQMGQTQILGKDDFLRILVTQLRHQDPLNPMKSEEFAAQLAQFSSVEQLQNINSNLENSIQMNMLLNQAISNTLATTLIGKSIKAVGNTLTLDNGQPVKLHYSLNDVAKKVTIEIRNSSGQVVRTIEINEKSKGTHSYEWDGKDDNGNKLPDGPYQFSVSAVDTNGNSVAAQPLIVGVIESIRYANGNAILKLGDLEVNLSDVLEIGMDDSEGF